MKQRESLRIFIKVLALLVMMQVVGCSLFFTKADESDRYAYIAKQKQQSFHDGIVNGIKKEMAVRHLDVDVFYAKHQKDLESQRGFIEKVIADGRYKGVMICPNDSEELTNDIEKLDDAGIPFVVIDTPLKESEVTRSFKNYCGYVGTDNFLVGEKALHYIGERLNSGSIVMVRGIHSHRSSLDREVGFVDALVKYPQFSIASFIVGDWATEPAYRAYLDLMKTKAGDVDAVFAYNDHMALGVSRYYDGRPALKRPLIVGVDGTVVGQRGLLENKIDAIVVQATELMGIDGLRMVVECANGNKVIPKDTLTPVTMITATRSLERSDS